MFNSILSRGRGWLKLFFQIVYLKGGWYELNSTDITFTYHIHKHKQFNSIPGIIVRTFWNVLICNPSFNIRWEKAKTVNSLICPFTLFVLHNMYQINQFKVNDDKFFIRNLLNVLQIVFKRKHWWNIIDMDRLKQK